MQLVQQDLLELTELQEIPEQLAQQDLLARLVTQVLLVLLVQLEFKVQ